MSRSTSAGSMSTNRLFTRFAGSTPDSTMRWIRRRGALYWRHTSLIVIHPSEWFVMPSRCRLRAIDARLREVPTIFNSPSCRAATSASLHHWRAFVTGRWRALRGAGLPRALLTPSRARTCLRPLCDLPRRAASWGPVRDGSDARAMARALSSSAHRARSGRFSMGAEMGGADGSPWVRQEPSLRSRWPHRGHVIYATTSHPRSTRARAMMTGGTTGGGRCCPSCQ